VPPLLEIEDLSVQFVTSHGTVRAVEDVSYAVRPGEMVAIVGESGSGKSVSALAIMRLLPPGTARITKGSVRFDGRELLTLSDEEMRRIRGRDIAMIFQEPMTSLNPVLKIGLQIMEPLTIHLQMDGAAARARAIELLNLVGITDIVVSTGAAIGAKMYDIPIGFNWYIVNFYVPLLIVTHGMMISRLVREAMSERERGGYAA